MNVSIGLIILVGLFASPLASADCASLIAKDGVAPTDRSTTNIRKGAGEYGSARNWSGTGNKHTGVDIVKNQSNEDAISYEVRAVAAGEVAYVKENGAYGDVVIVDHGNGCYSMYAHLANKPFTPKDPGGNAFVKMGQSLAMGERLGYLKYLTGDTDSSGNAQSIGDEAARIQTHFSLFTAPPGKTSTGVIIGQILKSKDDYVDPTPLLARLGYKVL